MASPAFSQNDRGFPRWLPYLPYDRRWLLGNPIVPPVLLLRRAVRGALVGTLVALHFALGTVKDRPNHLLTRGVACRDVEEFLSGPRALAS
jgi:hypothetical protein